MIMDPHFTPTGKLLDLSKCPSCSHPKHIGGRCGFQEVIPGQEHLTKPACECSDAQARKASKGKPGGFHLIPWRAITAVAGIYAYGAKKYAANSWREVPLDPDTGETPAERYFNAMMRHLIAWKKGEWIDPESGHSHLAHALWGVIAVFELSMDEMGKGKDDTV
jgi:hypothetical protein